MRERIIEQAQRYQPPFNKGPSMKYSMWKLCSVWHLYSVRTVCSVWHLHSVWNFCSVWHSVWNFYSVWSFCYMGRFRFNNTPPSSERGPRFLIVGRKRVSAYDLWQCPCYRFKKEIACVLLSWYALRGEALRPPPCTPPPAFIFNRLPLLPILILFFHKHLLVGFILSFLILNLY